MKKRSLTRRTIQTTICSCFILTFVGLFIGLSIYGSLLINQYINRSFQIAKRARLNSLSVVDNSIELARNVMDIYHSLTPEERLADDYLDHYSQFTESLATAQDYDTLFHMLQSYIVDVDDVYIAMYDSDTQALVYIVDGDLNADTRLQIGEWETVPKRECDKFLNWNGEGMLYDIGRMEKYGWICTAGYPMMDKNGVIRAYLLVDVMLTSLIIDLARYALKVSLALLASTILIAWLVTKHMKKMVADPINGIAKAAAAYVEDKKAGIEKSHFTDLGIDSGYEITNLTNVMADMEYTLTEHENRIKKITAEEERINTELNMAKMIQESSLPSTFPPYPDRPEFDIYATMEPAREVGGDFYDFYLIDDDHLCIVMADVSGKGIPAALFMMTTKTTIQNCALLGMGAAEILRSTNETICSNNQMQMFVTVWLGILEISTGIVRAANAGHEYPAIMKNGSFELLKDKHGFVIGGMDGITYKEYDLILEPGDKLFVYTDGVPEATDAGNTMFSNDRMIRALNTDPEAAPDQILKNVSTAMDAFVKDAEQFDDLTMLCLAYHGSTPA